MSILATCPHCNAGHTLHQSLVGKEMHCQKCMKMFVIVPTLEAKALPPVARPAVLPPTPAAKPVRRGAEARPAGMSRRVRMALGIGLGVVLLAIAGVIGGIMLVVHFWPTDMDRNLAGLKAADSDTRSQSLDWLASADVQDPYRPAVTAALEPMLFEHDMDPSLNPDVVLCAYLHWASADNIPTLIRLVRSPKMSRHWTHEKAGRVMETIGKLQDKRGLDVLAEKLSDLELHGQAMAALQLYGPKAEDAVVGLLFDADPATRKRVSQLLSEYGTAQPKIRAEALARLKSNQPEVQRGAAMWFADNAPDDEWHKPEVAHALGRMLDDLSPKANALAIAALQFWATKDCLPQLVAFAQRESGRRPDQPGPDDTMLKLIDILARFRDEAAADAIAQQLKHEALRGRASQALYNLGPTANNAVLQRINHPEPAVHKEARRLAERMKISPDAQLAQTLADIADGKIGRVHVALKHLLQFRPDDANRSKVAQALNGPLTDADKGIQEDALAAVRAWRTRENTQTLLKLLGDGSADGPGRDPRLIELLGELKDPTAAKSIAQGLLHRSEHTVAVAALKAIGPAAEGEVILYLQSQVPGARFEACRVLAAIGTEKSLAALGKARQFYQNDFEFQQQAANATQQIEMRK